MKYLGEIKYNTIHIIESIKSPDYYRSGKQLYENIKYLEFKENNRINIKFSPVTSFSDLKGVLEQVLEDTFKGILPIIHFETQHGCKSYFQLKNEEQIP